MSDQELMQNAFAHFDRAMTARSRMTIRIGRRVTFIIRTSAIAFTLVASVLLFLVITLSIKTQNIMETIVTMNSHFDRMTHDMKIMRHEMVQMNGHMQSIPLMTVDVQAMSSSMRSIQERTNHMSKKIAAIGGSVNQMGNTTKQMSISFQHMDQQLNAIGGDMNQISQPMRSFNRIFPFTPY